MPGLLDTLEELFGTRDLYAVLDVEKNVGGRELSLGLE